MPFISIDSPKIDKETKGKLAEEVTKTVSKVLNMEKDHISIIIRENETDNVAQGGKLLTDIINENRKK